MYLKIISKVILRDKRYSILAKEKKIRLPPKQKIICIYLISKDVSIKQEADETDYNKI